MTKHPQPLLRDIDARQLAELARNEFDAVCFQDCDLTGADLGPLRLTDCVFERCNLTLATWRSASLHHVHFRACKLLGADLTVVRAALLTVGFEDCKLDYANFGGLRLGKTRFERCSLVEAVFIGTDLSGAVFAGCDVSRATFQGANLTGADLRGAGGLVLDPDQNRMAKAKIGLEGLPGLLTKYKLEID